MSDDARSSFPAAAGSSRRFYGVAQTSVAYQEVVVDHLVGAASDEDVAHLEAWVLDYFTN